MFLASENIDFTGLSHVFLLGGGEWMTLFSMFEPCRARTVRSLGSALIVDGLTFRSLKDRKSRLVNLANFLIWGKDLFEENKQMFYMDSV